MLKKRIITGMILLVAVLAILFGVSTDLFSVIAGLIFLAAAWEWTTVAGFCGYPVHSIYTFITALLAYVLYRFFHVQFILGLGISWWIIACIFITTYPVSGSLWTSKYVRLFLGWFILIPAWSSVVAIRQHEYGRLLLLYLLGVVCITDTAAFFIGKYFGKHTLAPLVSPKKTWEGVLGGLFFTILFSLALGRYFHISWWHQIFMLCITAVLSCFVIVGDLTESMFKRSENLKDSGSLLPGHGGVLDRMDGFTAAAPFFAMFWMVLGI